MFWGLKAKYQAISRSRMESCQMVSLQVFWDVCLAWYGCSGHDRQTPPAMSTVQSWSTIARYICHHHQPYNC